MSTDSRNRKKSFSLHRASHDPRAAALVALTGVLDSGIDSQAAVDEALASSDMPPTDKRLCTELVYGVLRQYLRLEWFARRFLAKPEKLPREMFLTLVMALYEMTFLRIPPHATLGWAVSHVRNRFSQGLAGVANGSLRSMQRSLTEFHRPSLYAKSFDTLEERLACLYALPVWIVRLWVDAYGLDEALWLMRASHEPAPTGLRLNRSFSDWEESRAALLSMGKEGMPTGEEEAPIEPVGESAPAGKRRMKTGVEATSVVAALLLEREKGGGEGLSGDVAPTSPALPQAPRIEGALAVGSCALAFGGSLPWQAKQLVKEGRAERQSAASFEILEHFVPETWPGPIWDACAGRGGKTLALLERGIAVALAGDASAARMASLQAELAKRDLACPPPTLAVGSALSIHGERAKNGEPLPERFGTVLIDAPCSGLGTLSRRPEIRLRRSPADVATLAALQRDLLGEGARRVNPGGCLVYLTCTRSPAENEEQRSLFLASHGDFTAEKEFATRADSPLREFFYGVLFRRQ